MSQPWTTSMMIDGHLRTTDVHVLSLVRKYLDNMSWEIEDQVELLVSREPDMTEERAYQIILNSIDDGWAGRIWSMPKEYKPIVFECMHEHFSKYSWDEVSNGKARLPKAEKEAVELFWLMRNLTFNYMHVNHEYKVYYDMLPTYDVMDTNETLTRMCGDVVDIVMNSNEPNIATSIVENVYGCLINRIQKQIVQEGIRIKKHEYIITDYDTMTFMSEVREQLMIEDIIKYALNGTPISDLLA